MNASVSVDPMNPQKGWLCYGWLFVNHCYFFYIKWTFIQGGLCSIKILRIFIGHLNFRKFSASYIGRWKKFHEITSCQPEAGFGILLVEWVHKENSADCIKSASHFSDLNLPRQTDRYIIDIYRNIYYNLLINYQV